MAERLPSTDAVLPTKAASKPTPQQPDLLSKFLAAHDARPAFMSDTLVQTMAVSMAFAGSETTAISLSAVFYYLLRNPACLERLRAEIDDAAKSGAFSDNEDGIVTFSESQKLKYLDASIKEAFRMHPAGGLPLERIVPPSGADIAGHFVKGGTIVGCSAWVIHRNKEVFGEDVETYRPERWLVGEGRGKEGMEGVDVEEEERRIRGMDGCMIQFGMGSRTCIGKNISLLEIYKLVPSFLRRFEVSPSLSQSLPPSFFYLLLSSVLFFWKIRDREGNTECQTLTDSQLKFQDPAKEWRLINAWFVKQVDFQTMFEKRPLVQSEA